MMRFGVDVSGGAFVDVRQKLRRRKHFTAPFAALQRMLTDDFFPDRQGSDIFRINRTDGICRANVGTGHTTDATAFNGHDKIEPLAFFHFQGSGSDDFFADPNAQAAAHATIRWRTRINPMLFCQRDDALGLRRHFQEILKRPCAGTPDGFAPGFYNQSFFYLQNARQHRDLPARGFSRHLHGA